MDQSISQLQEAAVINLNDWMAIAQEGASESKKASLDNMRKIFAASAVSGISNVIPDTSYVPPSSPPGTIVYFMGPETYPNFPIAGGGDLVLTEAFNAVTWDGTAAQALEIPISVDLSGYATKEEALFDPTVSKGLYDQHVLAIKGVDTSKAVVSVNPEGKYQLTVAPNDNSFGMNLGFGAGYVVPAGRETKFEVLLYIETIPVAELIKRFLYTREGEAQTVSTAPLVDIGGGYYTMTATLNETVDTTLNLLGVQYSSDVTYPSEIVMVVQDVKVTYALPSIATLENEQTREIKSTLESMLAETETELLDRVEIADYVNDFLIVPHGEAVAIERGFSGNTGDDITSSNTQANFHNYLFERTMHCMAYARVSDLIDGLRFYVINFHTGGSQAIGLSAFPVPGETDLYEIAFDFTPASDNKRLVLVIQAIGLEPLSSDFYAYYEKVWYTQPYERSPTGQSSIEDGIEREINMAIAGISEPKVTEITVSADTTDVSAAFTGKNAVQEALNSITDASSANRYRVVAKPGLYKIVNSSEYIGNPGYPAMIAMKDYVDVVGVDKENTIFWAELPYEDADIDTAEIRTKHQTVWNWAKDATMSNVTLVAKNIRYTIHQDRALAAESARYYDNVDVFFIGGKGSKKAWGLGTWNGEENYVKGGRSSCSELAVWSCHNNTSFKEQSKWSFDGHSFLAETSVPALQTISNGSLLKDQLKLVGCSLEGKGYAIDYKSNWLTAENGKDGFNHAEWELSGHGNSPFLFNNIVFGGFVLKVTSASTGPASTVRFTGDAYDVLIKNPRLNDVPVFIPETLFIDGYLARDGSTGLPGYANGCRDLNEIVYPYDSVNYTGMGTRLGDCSTVNKTLTVTVDGTPYNVVFDKDYTAVSNAGILTEINTVLGAAANAELKVYGLNYYPMMPDVSELVYNESTTVPIAKGTVLAKVSGRVRPATTGDVVFGVALDDIQVFANVQGVITGRGRALKRGYISTDPANAFYVNSQVQAALGDRFLANNGELVLDANGTVGTKDIGVVAINC